MTQSCHQPQAALAGFPDSMQQDSSMSANYLFGLSQYPESVVFWRDPSPPPPAMAVFVSYPSKQPTLLQPIPDQNKHKRTRSGCFTCRARHIKCDEGRPICKRCRKGNRECVYPSPTASYTGTRAAGKSRSARPPSQGNGYSDKFEHEQVSPLEPIIDEEEPDGARFGLWQSSSGGASPSRPDLRRRQSGQSLQNHSIKPVSDASEIGEDPSSSPSTEGSRFEPMSIRSPSIGHSISELLSTAQLPDDLWFYLNFHQEFISHEHFFLMLGSARFIHHSIVELALGYEPLLYALVGFSAYHHSLQCPGENNFAFLKYYNKASVFLRKSLGSGEEHTEATLCTVLMLRTFEEYIGDWVNLIDHRSAAHALMQELLTPESSNLIELHTNIFLWYSRFDVVAGNLAGTEAILSRDWYLAKEEYDQEQAALNPTDPDKQLVPRSTDVPASTWLHSMGDQLD